MSSNEFARRASLIVFALVAATSSTPAQTTISLGAAEKVAILGGSTVTNAGPTSVIGNVALSSPGVSVTGFPPGTITGGAIHIGDALANQAHADAAIAYGQLAGEALTTDLSGQNLGGMMLTPGVYHFDIAATDVLLSSNARLEGILIANLRTVRLSGQSRVTGEVIAKKIVMSGGSRIIHPPVVSPEQPPAP